jgi:hypothetical protein
VTTAFFVKKPPRGREDYLFLLAMRKLNKIKGGTWPVAMSTSSGTADGL